MSPWDPRGEKKNCGAEKVFEQIMVLKLSKFGERHKPTDWRSWTYCILGGKNGISMYKHITFKWEKKKSWKQLKKNDARHRETAV